MTTVDHSPMPPSTPAVAATELNTFSPPGSAVPIAPGAASAVWAWVSRLDVVLVAVLAVLAVAPFRSLFVSSRVLILTGGIVVLCLFVNVLTTRMRAWLAVFAALVVAGAYVVVVVFRFGAQNGRALSSVWKGLSGGWADLLTATIPASTTPELAALPVLVGWSAAEAGLLLATRTRSASTPILPAIVAFGVALLFTGEQGVAAPALVGALIVVALLIVLLRANRGASAGPSTGMAGGGFGLDRSRRSMPSGQLRLGALVVGVVALGAVLAGPFVPITSKSGRVDLHNRYHPPLDVSDALSPLSSLRANLNDPSQTPLFSVKFATIPAGTTIDRIRSVVLDTYDGTVWGTDATFALAGSELPRGPSSALPSITVSQKYHLASGYTSSFLPALDRPVSVSGVGLGFDRTSGMVIAGSTKRADYTYSVTSDIPVVSEAAARAARPGNDPAFSRLSLPPPGGWPAEIARFAAGFSSATRYDELMKLRAELLSVDFGYDTKARPGHSLGVLKGFLTAAPGGSGVSTARVGYAEQFAAAFAVLARVEGMPSRVVVGYLIDPAAAAAGKQIDVLPKDIHAWAEVNLNGVGWVPFDPTNRTPRAAIPPPAPEVTVAPASTVSPSTVTATTLPNNRPRPPTKKASPAGGLPIGVYIGGGLLLLAPLSVVTAKMLMRRGRRTRGSPADRAVGAWHETRDRLSTHGRLVQRSSTVTEAAAAASPAVAPALHTLAPIVDRALFAEEEPDDDLVTAAWESEAIVKNGLSDESGIGHRLRAAVDPRPLVDAIRHRRSG